MRILSSLLLGLLVGVCGYLIAGVVLYGANIGSGKAIGSRVLVHLSTRPIPIVVGVLSFLIVVWFRIRK
jgi:hypothetical protein